MASNIRLNAFEAPLRRAMKPDTASETAQAGLSKSTIQRAMLPSTLTPSDLLSLQRTIGNRATNDLVQKGRKGSPPIDHAHAANKPGRMQVGAVDDPYEHAAEKAAESVTGHAQGGKTHRLPPAVQRQAQLEGGAIDTATEAEIRNAQGGGQPLAPEMQRSMEGKLGANLERVRIHTDARAERINRSLHASASTLQQDVFFGKGAYQPQTANGRNVLAHELSHVVQQSPEISTRVDGGAGSGPAAPHGVIQRRLNWYDYNLTTFDAKEPDLPNNLPPYGKLERKYYKNIVKLLAHYNTLSDDEKESKVGLSWLDAIRRAVEGWYLNQADFMKNGYIDLNPNVQEHSYMLEQFSVALNYEYNQMVRKHESGLRGNKKLGKGAIGEVLKVKTHWLRKDKVWKEEGFAGSGGTNEAQAANAPSAMGVKFWGSNLSGRSVASSSVDKALLGKSGVLSRSKFGVRNGKFGQIQDFVKGSTLKSKTNDERTKLYQNWKVVRDLQHLQMLDYISGQVDRHHDNILVTKSGIKGIDNDFSYGKKQISNLQAWEYPANKIHNKGFPQYITKTFARSITSMSEDKLRGMLQGKMRPEEVETAVAHLQEAKSAIEDQTITLLDNKASAWKAVLDLVDRKKSYLYTRTGAK